MRVSDTVRKSAIFIGIDNKVKGTVIYGGTGFLVTVPWPSCPNRTFSYAVTARHVIEKIKDLIGEQGRFVIRVNTTDGKSVECDVGFNHWAYHSDDSVDAALSIFAPSLRGPIGFDTCAVPVGNFLTEEDIPKYSIGAGDEVFMTGLFTRAPGRSKNMAIVRMGNIAAIPDEQIVHQGKSIDAYLIEGRSIGGLSGSPAFVSSTVIMPYKFDEQGRPKEYAWLSGQTFFMGLVMGHWDAPPSPDLTSDAEKVNMGISIVVPAKKIREMLYSSEQEQLRRLVEADALSEDADSVTIDTGFTEADHLEKGDFTRADFEAAIRTVSRKIDPITQKS